MIIAFAGQKGGAGKSTAAVCIAAEALDRGDSVLMVDADPQGTARTWGDVAAEAGFPAPVVFAMGAQMHRPEQLPKLAANFDLVVIDCPPRAGDVQRSALMIADLVVLPCGPTAADAWGLAGSLELVREAQTLRSELQAAVLLTRVQARTSLGKGARRVLADCGVAVLRTELGYRVDFQECLAAGRGVTTYAAHSAAASEVRALFFELEALWDARPPPTKSHGKAAKTRR